ncbi:hypothetical protein UlMin_035850, partial [Ulmus minor]
MGCGGSKVDDLPLVIRCRERKDLIRAASDHRYALAVAHVSYFQSLRDIGEALRKFVDEELVIGADSSSFPGSPVLTLPSDEGKSKSKRKTKSGEDSKNSSSSTSISHLHSPEEDIEDSHLHLSSGSDSDSELGSSEGHIHVEESPEENRAPPSQSYPPQGYFPQSYPPQGYPPPDWTYPNFPGGSSFNMYFAKRSGTPIQSVVYEQPESRRYSAANGQGSDSSYGYSGYPQNGNGGFFGYSMSSSPPPGEYPYRQPTPSPPPAPPSPPRVSTWDYLNVFETYDNSGYPGYYPTSRYGFASTSSSPDSKEVREREGIPELEDETEQEVSKEVHKAKKKVYENEDRMNRNKNFGEGTSKAVPVVPSSHESSERGSKAAPVGSSNSPESVQGTERKSSSATIDTIETSVSKSSEEEHSRKKGVSFEVEEAPTMDVESSKRSSLTTLSVHGTRDLQEVVKEIKDEFETASSYGKEVAVLLEVGKLPYQPRGTPLKVIFSRIMYLVAPSLLSSEPPSRSSVRLSSRTIKLAKAYNGEPGKDFKFGNLTSTLEKLYEWEKKLYKEVKDEERLRVMYEKQWKKLKHLDDHGAESTKIDATEASIRKLQTRINVCIRTVDAISSRIHKLRDEELLPQLTELIHGLMRMWKSMLMCHQKQFQAIVESKLRSLKVNFQRDT